MNTAAFSPVYAAAALAQTFVSATFGGKIDDADAAKLERGIGDLLELSHGEWNGMTTATDHGNAIGMIETVLRLRNITAELANTYAGVDFLTLRHYLDRMLVWLCGAVHGLCGVSDELFASEVG